MKDFPPIFVKARAGPVHVYETRIHKRSFCFMSPLYHFDLSSDMNRRRLKSSSHAVLSLSVEICLRSNIMLYRTEMIFF